MYPRIIIDTNKLKNNLEAVAKITVDQGGCSLMIVTKALCADEKLLDLVCQHPQVSYVADSRIKNIKTYADKVHAAGKETVLLRLPMCSEAEEVVRYADLSFNSEITTLRALNEAAGKLGKTHKVLLMIDLGDLREGIFYQKDEDIFAAVEEILSLENLRFHGIGVNLTCYGAIIPKKDNLSLLVEWKDKIEQRYDITLPMVSGGNSSSIYLIEKGELPAGINNLRLGESFLLGNDTAYGTTVTGTVDDAVILEAEVIEHKEKPSLPIGEIGMDAFGHVPEYEDRGPMQRVIIAIGQQDVPPDSVEPLDAAIEVMGASSDHMILDVTKSSQPYRVGDIVAAKLGYGGILRTTTSKYVERVYK